MNGIMGNKGGLGDIYELMVGIGVKEGKCAAKPVNTGLWGEFEIVVEVNKLIKRDYEGRIFKVKCHKM